MADASIRIMTFQKTHSIDNTASAEIAARRI